MKHRLAAAMAILLLLSCALPAQAVSGAPAVEAKACILMEKETGTILYEENSHTQLEPASVTKVMTMLLVMEAVDSGKRVEIKY